MATPSFEFHNVHKGDKLPPYDQSLLPPVTHNLSMINTYKDKTLFINGVTGFVGKVMLEKILRSLGMIKKLYVMVRPKKGMTPQERLLSEVFSSQIFDPLRATHGANFDAFISQKVFAVAGELTAEKVGLSDHDYEMLADEVNIIVHCAAVVDFNERLDRAIELNTLGSLRMLDLAKKCKDLGSFVHVSTCYVNSNRDNGHIEEKLYPLGFDPEEMIDRVSKLSSTELDTVATSGILGNWPNTYTMTKAMTEHLLVKYRGNVPLAIVRPSIVGASWSEPMPGWVDCISAAGSMYVALGMGVIKMLEGTPKSVGDVIPVDYVVNAILVAAAAIWKKKDNYFVAQAASSSENPMCWGYAMDSVLPYFKTHPPPRAIAPTRLSFHTPQAFQIRFFLEYSIPSAILNTLSLTGNKSYKNRAQLFQKLLWQVRVVTEAFKYFVINQWCYDNRNVRSIYSMLVPEEREIFDLDLSTLDWLRYSELFSYGLCKYTLKMPIVPALARNARYINIIDHYYDPEKNTFVHRYFPDFARVRDLYNKKYVESKTPMFPRPMDPKANKAMVLQSREVQQAIESEAAKLAKQQQGKKKSNNGLKSYTPLEQAERRAKSIVNEMFDEQDEKVLAPLALFFTKLWRRVYESVKVGQENLPLVQHAAHQTSKPIVYIPTHRSYVDFLLLSFVCFMVDLPLPHIVAGEDFLGIMAVRWLFRKSGAFFMKRSFANDPLYSTILQKNIDGILSTGQALEFFIEGTRSRSGKMLQPKMGLLGKVLNAVNRGVVEDVTIVPISINYEKTMEAFMYANELNGESKIKESLSSLLQARGVVSKNFGTTTILFGKPFSLNEWKNSYCTAMRSTPQQYFSQNNALYQSSLKFSPIQQYTGGNNETVLSAYMQYIAQNYQNFLNGFQTTTTAAAPAQTTTATGMWMNHAIAQQTTKTAQANAVVTYDPSQNFGHKLYYNRSLAHYITYTLNAQNEVFGTHIVATILLQYRSGITYQQLTDRVQWLIQQIVSRGGYISHLEMNSVDSFIQNSIAQLGEDLIQVTKRNNIYQPKIHHNATTKDNNYTNLLVFGQYKNRIIHFFYYEALWSVVIYALLQQREKQQQLEQQQNGATSPSSSSAAADDSVDVDAALVKVKFLHSLLNTEFITTPIIDAPVDFEAILNSMVEKQILVKSADAKTISIDYAHGEVAFAFLCSLLWPYLDSLYSAAMLLLSLQSTQTVTTSITPLDNSQDKTSTSRPVATKDMLVLQSQWYANTLYHDSMVCFYESCSKDTLDNIITNFKEMGLLQPVNYGSPKVTPDAQCAALMSNNTSDKLILGNYYDQQPRVLDQFIEALNMLRKQPPVLTKAQRSVTFNNADAGNANNRKFLAFDLPMLAKGPRTKF